MSVFSFHYRMAENISVNSKSNEEFESIANSDCSVTPVTLTSDSDTDSSVIEQQDLQRVSQVSQSVISNVTHSVTKPGYTLTPRVTPIVTNRNKRNTKETPEVLPKKLKEEPLKLVTNELRPYSCTTCDLKFKTLDKLVKHATVHELPKGVKKIGTNYKCDTCAYKFTSQVTYNGHSCPSQPIVAAQCPDCEYVFPTKNDLIIHLELTRDQ